MASSLRATTAVLVLLTVACGESFALRGTDGAGASGGESGGAADSTGAGAAGGSGELGGAEPLSDGGAGGVLAEPECGNGVKEEPEGCDGSDVPLGMMCTDKCKSVLPDGCPGAPVSIALDQTIMIAGDTTMASDQFGTSPMQGGCGGALAPDLVYAITALADGELIVELEAVQSEDFLVLSVQPTCDGVVSQIDGGCPDPFFRQVAAFDTVFAIVDGAGPNSGPFTLTVSLFGD